MQTTSPDNPETNDLETLMSFAVEVAHEAGEAITASSAAAYHFKADASPVGEADIAADRVIRRRIQERFPEHLVVSEEVENSVAHIGARGPLWIVDPLDGTLNLLHRRPNVAVAIAFAQMHCVEVGVVHDPIAGVTYSAARGLGAWRDGEPIHVSDQRTLRRALVGTGFPHDRRQIEGVLARLRAVLLSCQDVRRLGSPALDLCWVADGRLDAFYEDLFPWDVAAACLIAREAGASCGHIGPVPDGTSPDLYGEGVVVATPAIYDGLVALLRSVE